MSLDELISSSPLIVRATAEVIEFDGHQTPEGPPCTYTRLRISETLRGSGDQSLIEYCSPGGILPDGRVSIPVGIPMLVEGETCLYLSTDVNIQTSDIQVANYGGNMTIGDTGVYNVSFVIPASAVKNQLYRIGVIIDPFDKFSESDESNNTTPLHLKVKRTCD